MNKFTTGFVFDNEDPSLDCPSIAELQVALEKRRPKTLKLFGDWRGLEALPEFLTSSVESLWISGEKLKEIPELSSFKKTKRLIIHSSTPPLVNFEGLESLESCDIQWRDMRSLSVLNLTPISTLALDGFKSADFNGWPINSKLTSLALTKTAIINCQGIGALSHLNILDIRRASNLNSFEGIGKPLASVYLMDAPKLTCLNLNSAKATIRSIMLLGVNACIDLSDAYDCKQLETLIVAGSLDIQFEWHKAVELPKLQRVQGVWNSEDYSEQDIVNLAENNGKRVKKLEFSGKGKKRWLLAEFDIS